MLLFIINIILSSKQKKILLNTSEKGLECFQHCRYHVLLLEILEDILQFTFDIRFLRMYLFFRVGHVVGGGAP